MLLTDLVSSCTRIGGSFMFLCIGNINIDAGLAHTWDQVYLVLHRSTQNYHSRHLSAYILHEDVPQTAGYLTGSLHSPIHVRNNLFCNTRIFCPCKNFLLCNKYFYLSFLVSVDSKCCHVIVEMLSMISEYYFIRCINNLRVI